MVYWLSLVHNFNKQSLKSEMNKEIIITVKVQIVLVACWRFVIARISYNGPSQK